MSNKSSVKNVLKIIQGEDRVIKMSLKQKSCDEISALDLNTATEISVIFKNADKTELTKTLTGTDVSVSNANQGKIQVSLTDTETQALRVGENQDFKVKVDFGSETRIIKFDNCLTIEKCD